MLVAPDNKTFNKVPNIDGMMVYRKDNNKLYVESEGNLKQLAEKKVIPKSTVRSAVLGVNPGQGGLI